MTMKGFLFDVAATMFAVASALESPDGANEVLFSLKSGAPVVEVRHKGSFVMKAFPAYVVPDPFVGGFSLVGTSRKSHSDSWRPVWGERSLVRDDWKGETHELLEKGPRARRMFIDVRTYPEGIAFRCRMPADEGGGHYVFEEKTRIAYPREAQCRPISFAEHMHSEESISFFDACMHTNTVWMSPFTAEMPGQWAASFMEAHAKSHARMKLLANGKDWLSVNLCSTAWGKGDYEGPWRVVQIGDDAARLAENSTLVLNLSDPCAIGDTSWIKPGLTVSCYAGNAERIQSDLERLADTMYTNNCRYLQIDWGWYGTEWAWSDEDRAYYFALDPEKRTDPAVEANTRSDLRKVAKGTVPYTPWRKRTVEVDFDLDRLVKHLEKRGMGLCLYVRGLALEKERDIDALFAWYEAKGVKGLKPGFVRHKTADDMRWIENLIATAARHHLWLDIHDLYLPDGIQRTYPNLFTAECGGGEEQHFPAHHDCVLPFTRCLAGPFDYTPCIFDPKATKDHAAAMLIVYHGPTAVLRGGARNIFAPDNEHPAWGAELEFVRNLPMDWDETRFLEASIARYVTVARRKGEVWFLGGITGSSAHEVDVPLAGIVRKTATISLFKDGRKIVRTASRNENLKVVLGAADGFTAIVTPSEGLPAGFALAFPQGFR